MTTQSPLIRVMTEAALKAAKDMRRDYGELDKLQVSKKGTADFVTNADMRANKTIQYELSKARPRFGYMSEEGEEIIGQDKDYRWIVDPLDGTTNFIHAIPHFCISIAMEKFGEIIAGVIYDPLRDEMFWAEKGCGAYLNKNRIRVSGRSKLAEAVLATGIPHLGRKGHETFLEAMGHILPNVAGVRRFGSAALDLAYVAAGRFDTYWEMGLHPWDIAAGSIIVQEAGGLVTDMNDKKDFMDTGSIVAANDTLHTPLIRLLKKVGKEKG